MDILTHLSFIPFYLFVGSMVIVIAYNYFKKGN
jgi:hypothetical protein